jgi:hypothetical protein
MSKIKKQFAFILLLTIRFLMLAVSKAETGMGYWNGQRCFWSPVDGLEDCDPSFYSILKFRQ